MSAACSWSEGAQYYWHSQVHWLVGMLSPTITLTTTNQQNLQYALAAAVYTLHIYTVCTVHALTMLGKGQLMHVL